MKIISFSGAAGSGKDTACALLSMLMDEHGITHKKVSFAKPIKDACSLWFGWDRGLLECDESYKNSMLNPDGTVDKYCEALGMTRRVIMQKLGTDALRNGLHQDFWIILTKFAMEDPEFANADYGFITDARFLNELAFAHEHGYTVKIDGGTALSTSEEMQHISEQEWRQWTDWDFVISNNRKDSLSPKENLENLRNMLDVTFFGVEFL